VRLLVYATPVVLHRGYLPRSRGRAWATISGEVAEEG